MIPTLPIRPRNRLAETILAALHDPRARDELLALACTPAGRPPAGWLAAGEERHAIALVARARCAALALDRHAPGRPDPPLDEGLEAAATLFDAGLYFEVHELLEPYWRQAEGRSRDALQGLIQIAVGYQHLANDNLEGAHALLVEGAERIRRGQLSGLDLTHFASDVEALHRRFPHIDTADVPGFPRAARSGER